MNIILKSKTTLLISVAALGLFACRGQAQQAVTSAEADAPQSVISQPIANPVTYRFASLEEAGDILTKRDNHLNNMQLSEIGVRLKDPEDPSLEKLGVQYRAGLVPFSEAEKAIIMSVVEERRSDLASVRQYLPDEVLFAKISDEIEGGLPHTRSNLILFSETGFDEFMAMHETDVARARKELNTLFLHELHHVLTRANPEKMDDYFALIGFVPCKFEEPAELRLSRLTNPDAPEYRHYAPVDMGDTNGLIPYLSVSGPYDKTKGGTMGRYMDFGLLRVNVKDGTCSAATTKPQIVAPVPEFLELIGGNTGYIIHPEETLADNFVHYVMKIENLPNPEIPKAVGRFWSQK